MFFLNDKIKSDNGSGLINLLVELWAYQAHESKNYNCKKANHNTEMISKKRPEKSDNGLVIKINQV